MEQSIICRQCDESYGVWECCSCEKIVCDKENCSLTFPHYNDTLHVVCLNCKETIENKLKLVADVDKLKLVADVDKLKLVADVDKLKLVVVDVDKLKLLKQKIQKIQKRSRKIYKYIKI